MCVCHDNVFNREVLAGVGLFFEDESALSNLLNSASLALSVEEQLGTRARDRIVSYYNWDLIAERYDKLFSMLK